MLSQHHFRRFAAAVGVYCSLELLLVGAPLHCTAAEPTIRLTLRGERIEGSPVAWSDRDVLLLGRDGRLWSFPPANAKDFTKVSDRFQSVSQSEMRGVLEREFGDRYDVSGTGHYLVVHPAGEKDLWAERFEQLYREFVHYFAARGFRPRPPRFPLVAVVFHDRGEFTRFAVRDGVNLRGGTLGYYSPGTNRVLLYDTTAGRGPQADWTVNAETIIHEATHQSAFNTGIHNRLAAQPMWVAEGLATMFEAPGVWNSSQHRQQSDRINRYRLERFRNYVATRRTPGATERMIGSDRQFQSDADAAYAEAWALTFYLAEREPRKYVQLLAKIGARKPLADYPAARRLQDFRGVFGEDLPMLEVRVLRFIKGLKL